MFWGFVPQFFRCLILLVTLLFGRGAGAQTPRVAPIPGLPYWEWQTPQPTGYQLVATHIFSDSSLIAVGNHATAVRTRNNGRTWQVLPMPAGQDHDLTSVAFADSLNGWIGAETEATLPTHSRTGPGRVLHTTDGGRTWTVQPTGETQSVQLPRVIALSATEALLFTERQRRQRLTSGDYALMPRETVARRTTNGGRTWTPLPALPRFGSNPNTSDFIFHDVAFPAPNAGFAIIRDLVFGPAILLRTTDRGQSWQNVTPDTLNGFRPYRLQFLDPLNGWVSGGYPPFTPGVPYSRIFRTQDGGLTWQPVVSNLDFVTTAYVTDFSFADAAHGVALNNSTSFLTADSGHTWTPNPYPATLFGRTERAFLRPSGRGWLLGYGLLARTADYGQSWQVATALAEFDAFRRVTFSSPTHGWALPYRRNAFSQTAANRTVLRTADRGRHWQVLDLAQRAPAINWSMTNAQTYDGAFVDDDTTWLVGGWSNGGQFVPFALRTTDGGQVWGLQNVPAVPLDGLRGVHVGAWGTRRAALTTGAAGVMLVTHNGGQTWQRPVTPTSHPLLDVTWADSTTVYVTTDTAQLLKSTDAGRSWQVLPLQVFDPQSGFLAPVTRPALTFVSSRVGYFVISDWFVRTTDGGQTWRLEKHLGAIGTRTFNDDNTLRLTEVAFTSPRDAYAVSTVDVFVTHDAGQQWTKLAYVTGGYYQSAAGEGLSAGIDRYNAFFAGRGLSHYSEKYIQTDASANQRLTYCTGDLLTLAFDTTGFFSLAEDSFRLELSNPMGRFRPHETTLLPLIGRANASPLRATLPATLTPGTRYRLRVIRADSSVLGGDNQRDVTIWSRPAAVAVAPADSARFCAGDSVLLTAPAGFAAYRWTSGDTTATLWVTQANTYAVQVASGGRCFGPLSPAVTVRVTPTPPAPGFSVQPQTSGIVVLTSTSPTGNQWYFNGQPIPGATAATYSVTTATQSGAYSLQVNQRGCASPLSPPQTITVTGTAAEAVAALGLTLVPNPAQQRLRLTSGEAVQEVTLTDLSGRVLLRRTLEKVTSVELALPRLPTGTYLLTAITPSGRSATRRLLIAP